MRDKCTSAAPKGSRETLAEQARALELRRKALAAELAEVNARLEAIHAKWVHARRRPSKQ